MAYATIKTPRCLLTFDDGPDADVIPDAFCAHLLKKMYLQHFLLSDYGAIPSYSTPNHADGHAIANHVGPLPHGQMSYTQMRRQFLLYQCCVVVKYSHCVTHAHLVDGLIMWSPSLRGTHGHWDINAATISSLMGNIE